MRWIELREPGASEDPEFPAPVLKLKGAESDALDSEGAGAAGPTASALKDDVDSAKRLAGLAIAVALIAVLASVAGFVRKRS